MTPRSVILRYFGLRLANMCQGTNMCQGAVTPTPTPIAASTSPNV
jgi:hypothetical protein